jgi:hypothetical protein
MNTSIQSGGNRRWGSRQMRWSAVLPAQNIRTTATQPGRWRAGGAVQGARGWGEVEGAEGRVAAVDGLDGGGIVKSGEIWDLILLGCE